MKRDCNAFNEMVMNKGKCHYILILANNWWANSDATIHVSNDPRGLRNLGG